MSGPVHVLSARLQSETPVSSVPLEPYVLCRRADGTTVSAGELQRPGTGLVVTAGIPTLQARRAPADPASTPFLPPCRGGASRGARRQPLQRQVPLVSIGGDERRPGARALRPGRGGRWGGWGKHGQAGPAEPSALLAHLQQQTSISIGHISWSLNATDSCLCGFVVWAKWGGAQSHRRRRQQQQQASPRRLTEGQRAVR